jgi:UDP-N-acetylglucosamine diphosphorylase / glucose-1-phosphate thymidylyltransferase / UDP-N-acetylgalactosamine diphosphorylase / glucosamine-1-phosphate N-acetyltransferase / galactosamine-1-phosphate N-acetyltransferase
VGSYLGDHVKTGLGSLLNTGTNVGVFGSLLPAGELLPKFVPSFSWVERGRITDQIELSALFATAVKAMERRGEEFDENLRALYLNLFEKTAVIRRQSVREAEIKQLRRSA